MGSSSLNGYERDGHDWYSAREGGVKWELDSARSELVPLCLPACLPTVGARPNFPLDG